MSEPTSAATSRSSETPTHQHVPSALPPAAQDGGRKAMPSTTLPFSRLSRRRGTQSPGPIMTDPLSSAASSAPAVPHARTEPLPLPRHLPRRRPKARELGDELKDAYWSTWDGEASRTSMWKIFAKLPAIIHRVLAMAWRADARATLAVIVLQLGSAAMAAFGLLASIGVLQALFAQGATPDRIRAAFPSLALVAGLLMFRAVLDAGVALYQARLTPKIRRIVEMDFLRLAAHVRLEAVDDANWADDSIAPTTGGSTTPASPSRRSWNSRRRCSGSSVPPLC